MINYDSIISAYNDKPTLMEWLKKVEEALKGASATSFSVNKKGNATISFQIDFEDGTSLESGDIVLQQGESVASAAIVNGHLVLTLTNGDELDAGSVGAVSSFSIDASQHLIVNYQDGTTNDLGAIFNGNVNISGALSASSVSTASLTTSGTKISVDKEIESSNSIKATEILEVMSGYSLDNAYNPPASMTRDFVGCVKTGDKLTLVVAGKYTPDGTEASSFNFFAFRPPLSIYNKIVNVSVGGQPTADLQQVAFYSTVGADPIMRNIYVRAQYNTIIAQWPNKMNVDFVQGTEYFYRYEVTFLLGQNYAS